MIEINFLELAVSSTVKLSKVEPNLFHSSKNQDVNPSCPWQGILSERGPNWFQSQATQCGTQETHLSSAGRGLRFETERQRLVTQHHRRLSSERGLLHKQYFYSQCSDTGGTPRWYSTQHSESGAKQPVSLSSRRKWVGSMMDQTSWHRNVETGCGRGKVAASLVRQGARQLNNSWELSKN